MKIKGDWIKPGAAVIDVGTNAVDDPSRKSGYRLVGDVDFQEALKVAGWITPVPGGVGPMTVAMLLKNTLEGAKRQLKQWDIFDLNNHCFLTMRSNFQSHVQRNSQDFLFIAHVLFWNKMDCSLCLRKPKPDCWYVHEFCLRKNLPGKPNVCFLAFFCWSCECNLYSLKDMGIISLPIKYRYICCGLLAMGTIFFRGFLQISFHCWAIIIHHSDYSINNCWSQGV